MIERILPGWAAAADAFVDQDGVCPAPEERRLLAPGAVPKRRREFGTGRLCAHRALADLGADADSPVLRGSRGEPLWPSGVTGSITHCRGYRAAATAWSVDAESLGIDAEPAVPLARGLLDGIAGPAERARLARLAAADPDVPWATVLFSAKEAVYKAWHPVLRRPLGFRHVEVFLAPADGSIAVRPTAPGLPAAIGRFLVGDGLILTSVWLPPRPSP
jgi:4'-phosphopantetheinyl transferase EntD